MANILEVKNLCFGYYKSPLCVRDLSFALKKNSKMLILARKDEGKTTLMKVLSGFDDTYFGSICYNGEELKKIDDKLRNFSLLLSSPVVLKNKSIQENLDYLCDVLGKEKLAEKQIDELLDEYGISESRKTKLKKLSLSDQRKFAILRSHVKNPDILFLDDQFEGLSDEECKQMQTLYLKILSSDLTVVFALDDESYKRNREWLLLQKIDQICYFNVAQGICFANLHDFENGFADRDIFKFYLGFGSRLGEIERDNDEYFFVEENGKHRKFQRSFYPALDELKIENGLSEKVEIFWDKEVDFDTLSDPKFNDLISQKHIFCYLVLDGKKVFKTL